MNKGKNSIYCVETTVYLIGEHENYSHFDTFSFFHLRMRKCELTRRY